MLPMAWVMALIHRKCANVGNYAWMAIRICQTQMNESSGKVECSTINMSIRTRFRQRLQRDKLPKFNNDAVGGGMVFNCIDWGRDTKTPKVHPTQKPVPLLQYLIRIFTDPGDVVIDPCAGSGSTLFAAKELGRRAYGFEIKKDFFKAAQEKVLSCPIQASLF